MRPLRRQIITSTFMKRATKLGIALLIVQAPAAFAATEKSDQKPLLVVQITADQLRGDLLDRYSAALQLGFGRLEQNGYWIHRGDVDHALTLSFPGHATLATGIFPSHHGLTANEWWVQSKGAWAEVAVDDRHKTLDAPKREVVSPVNMTASTLGEWIKAADSRSKSVCLGMSGRIPKNVMRPGLTTDFPLWTNKQRPNHPARYNIIVRFKENMVIDAAAAVHGSPYAAHRFVPIIFSGSGTRHGEQQAGVRTVDVAPTLAAAAGVADPQQPGRSRDDGSARATVALAALHGCNALSFTC
jgi:hypothetical protein